MPEPLHYFETAATWKAARAWLVFEPVKPRYTAGLRVESVRIHVRDYKHRELAVRDRTLEARYGAFTISEAWKGVTEARRHALEVSYLQVPREVQIAGHAGRAYERGPEPPPDDIDGRSPSVVTWHDGEMHYFIASEELPSAELLPIAESFYVKNRSARAYSRYKPRT